ncbi:contractile injection system sheath initiator [Alkaliphilus crotonatoxidans]
MDYQINQRDLVKKGLGDLKLVLGQEAVKQRLMLRLTIEKGSFQYDEELGSHLKELHRAKPSQVKALADLYVREALAVEQDVDVESVEIQWRSRRSILLTVYYRWNGIEDSLEVII